MPPAARRPQSPEALRARLQRATNTQPSAQAEPAATDDDTIDTRPAAQRYGDAKQVQGINFDRDLLLYSRDVVARLSRAYPDEPGTASLAALVNQAVREKITDWERKFNGGRAFPPLV